MPTLMLSQNCLFCHGHEESHEANGWECEPAMIVMELHVYLVFSSSMSTSNVYGLRQLNIIPIYHSSPKIVL